MPVAMALLSTSLVNAQDAKPDPNVEAGKSTLSILDQTAQWSELFNGKDLTGWTGDTKGYFAKDGNLVCEAGGKNLFTEKEYSDFAFSF